MAPHTRSNKGSLKGTILSVLAIIIGIASCAVTLTASIDLRCRADIDYWMPIYPDSEVLAVQQRGFFRERASGITQIVYRTQDDSTTVRAWYRDYRRDITQNVSGEGNSDVAARGMATTSYRIIDDPDGNGTRIIQTSECAYN